jgi:ribosomal protein L11 methyltransferase
MDAPTTVARLACDEPTARRLAVFFSEILEAEDTVCSAFEGDGGQWQIALHFRNAPDRDALQDMVAQAAGADAALSFEEVAAGDWVAESLAGLTPVTAGRFIVHGAHDRARIGQNRIGIEIEAALAFGTGHHGTTRGCLLAIDALAKRARPRNVLDLGTGSGVLAIAAAKIFRTRVTATDIDPIAVASAKANARANRAGGIFFALAKGCAVRAVRARAPYDLILANILLPPLMRMAAPLSLLAARGGRVVLSGLLASHANAALSIYRAQGLVLERRIALEGWVTLVLKRR